MLCLDSSFNLKLSYTFLRTLFFYSVFDFSKNKIILIIFSIVLFYVCFIFYSDFDKFLKIYSEINFTFNVGKPKF